MAGPTANLPVGLLDSLGIKSGSYPRDLLETIASTLDLLPLLAVNVAQEIQSNSTVLAGLGPVNLFAVPQGETWLINALSVRVDCSTAQQVEVAPSVNGFDSVAAVAVHRQIGPLVGRAAVGTAFRALSANFGPFWASSGQNLGGFVMSQTGGPTMSANISFLRCRR